jgi:hypothetical protein
MVTSMGIALGADYHGTLFMTNIVITVDGGIARAE